MQVILDSSFARPGSAPIWGEKKVEFRDWTNLSWNIPLLFHGERSNYVLFGFLTIFYYFQGFLVESKLTKLLAPLERDEQSLMKLDAIFAVRIFLSVGLFPRHSKLCSEDLRFTLSIVLCFLVCLRHKQ